MPHYLKMPKQQHVIALLELGWSYRRIEGETGVRRETVSRYDRMRRANAAKTFPGSGPSAPGDHRERAAAEDPNAAKTFAGSESNAAKTFPGSGPSARRGRRFTAAAYRAAITEKLDVGLSVQRIWRDLVEEFGYAASYESVKRGSSPFTGISSWRIARAWPWWPRSRRLRARPSGTPRSA